MAERARFVLSFSMIAVCSALTYPSARTPTDTPIDQLFTAYAAGDPAVVARKMTLPNDFAPLTLEKPSVIDDWLGDWNPQKAAFVAELARAASDIAPAKTWPIISAGRRYIANRPSAPGASQTHDDFERMWHQVALALLQRHSLADYEESYFTALEKRVASATSTVVPERFAIARGIAQEQRCWNDRPDLDRAGAAVDAVAKAAGQEVHSRRGVSKSGLEEAREKQEACWTEALSRFMTASTGGASAEARVRGAWMLFHLGKPADAYKMIDGVDASGDPTLAHWAGLFRGRIADALGRTADAERAYRAALTAVPDTQSAGIGLALALFRLNRNADADAVAVAVRTSKTTVADPWGTYMEGDFRFVDRWLVTLRETKGRLQ